MNKRSLWQLTAVMLAFVLLNTFVLNKDPIAPPQSETIADVDISHLPIHALKNGNGYTICSTITLGDAAVTLSPDNLPENLFKGKEALHLIEKNADGVMIYSDKITPTLESSTKLKEGEDLLVITGLSGSEPSIHPATFLDGKIEFLKEAPAGNGVIVVEGPEGLSFAGLWKEESKTFVATKDLTGLEKSVIASNSPTSSSQEKFYCLENELMQVVFSDKGGAIAEINLKLRGKDDPNSSILPVALDRKVEAQSPKNNLYPLQKATIVTSGGERAYKESVQGGYIPLLRRDLIDNEGNITFKVPAKNYALALIDKENPEPTTFSVSKFTNDSIQFKGNIQGREVVRSFSLVKDAPYTLETNDTVNGNISSLVLTSGILEIESDTGSTTPTLLYYNYDGSKMKLKSFKLPKENLSYSDISPNWTASTNGFFGTIFNPKGINPKEIYSTKIEGKECPSRVTLVDIDKALNPSGNFPGYMIYTPYKSSIKGGSSVFYCGPLEKNILNQVDAAFSDKQTGANPEFIKALTVRGWLTFISDPFSRFMNTLLDFFHMITRSWGFSIILLTITLHLLLFPFGAKAHKSMIKMRKLGPKLKELESKYKNDPKRLRMEQAMFYRNEGINPLSSLLPLILPIPFFIGMFDLLRTKFTMRGVAFIPGWIDNLSAPDVVFSWGVNIPFIGNEFHLLPILGAAAMYISQKIATAGQPKKKNPTDMEKQMQSMGPILSVVFLFFFYNLPAGLNIYLIVSSLLRVAQSSYLNKKYGSKNSKVSAAKN
ncbi:membrane protein insertase YidC [bacterium]|nr:membrane protein insertase YidC [bacterium]